MADRVPKFARNVALVGAGVSAFGAYPNASSRDLFLEAFREAVSHTMELAANAGRYILERPALELLTPVSLGIVCFRVRPDDGALDELALENINRAVLVRIFWEDRALISSTTLDGTFSLRLCIVNHETSWQDVRETLDAVERFGVDAASRETR